MSTSDQDQRQDRRAGGPNGEASDQGRGADAPIAEAVAAPEAVAEADERGAREVADAQEPPGGPGGRGDEDGADVRSVREGQNGRKSPDGQDGPGPEGGRLTPRQARRLRIGLSAVGMAAMAVVLALRIASRSSLLVVGVYGLALILCGVVIELSRNGRTRLGSWLLGAGLLAAVGADWALLP
ncbi:hypothetical protein [Streptomyces pratensis]|uniref:hypothetical protein n=1 Tax=Streptomyces pratensis TaxID=1169025 RepID=UPI0030180B9C